VSALFSFKKADVTKKISSRQATSRTHVKKNLDRAISEFFLIKNFNEESEQFQDKTPSSLFQIARGSGLHPDGCIFSSKKEHTTRRSQEALHGFTQESTRTTLVPAQQDLKEQDEASRAQP
jgi:hypothetical protein